MTNVNIIAKYCFLFMVYGKLNQLNFKKFAYDRDTYTCEITKMVFNYNTKFRRINNLNFSTVQSELETIHT